MLGTIKSILEIALNVGSAAETLRKANKEAQLSELGKDLFLIYIRGIEVVDRGRKILKEIERYFKAIEGNAKNWTMEEHIKDITAYTVDQSDRIANLIFAIERLKAPLYAMDPVSTKYLFNLLHTKGGFMIQLDTVLREGNFPVHDDAQPFINESIERIQDRSVKKTDYQDKSFIKHSDTLGIYRVSEDQSLVELHNDRKERNIRNLKYSYQQLQTIEEILSKLHRVLLNHFELKDILIDIKDERIT